MDSESRQNFNQAVAYLDKVKDRLKDRPTQYAQFMEAMREHHNLGQLDNGQTYAEKAQLTRAKLGDVFREDPDLLEDLELFMPENLRTHTRDKQASQEGSESK